MEDDRTRADARDGAFVLPRNTSCRSLTRTFIESTVAEHVAAGDIVAICAEPGMGKTQLACAVAGRLHADEVELVTLTGLDSEMANVRLTKAARRLAPHIRKGKRPCVIVDDVCPADEYGVSRMARPIMRLHKLGAMLMLTLRPEAEQLLDGLDGCLRIGRGDLGMRCSEIAPQARSEAIMRASDGIPALVDAVRRNDPYDGTPDALLPAFGETLCGLAGAMIRDTLPDEERRVRFAAMLLGRGSHDDLREAVGGLRADAVTSALQEPVLISVDYAAKTFRCLGLEDDTGIMFCSDVLAAAGRAWPSCASAAVGALVGQGRAARAARIVSLLDEDRRIALSLRHGIEFLNAGETALVRSALAKEVYAEDVSPYAYETLDTAYRALWSDRTEDIAPGSRAFATAEDERDHVRACLLCRARELLGDASAADGAPSLEHDDGMAAGLAVHLEALSLLVHGRIGECRRLLRMYRPDGLDRTLPGALLVLDDEVARVLLCEEDAPNHERACESEEFFERMGFSPLAGWGGILGAVRETVLGEAVRSGLEASLSVAERRGDIVLAAALSCIVALSDLIGGAFVSAHVKAKHAGALADKGKSAELADVAALLQAVSAGYLEEPAAHKPLLRRSWASSQLESISDAVCMVLSEHPGRGVEASMPHDYLWLVAALANLPGSFAQRFRTAIRPAWQKRLRGIERSLRAPREIPSSPAVQQSDERKEAVPERGIEIRVFGGFSLRVNGIEIPGRDLSARNAGTVLALLAAVPGHSMPRAALIESAWPGSDYIGGRERIYQAVSRIRRIVARIDESLEPIALARNDGAIAFKEGQIHCDIDDFVGVARSIMGMEGRQDEAVVDAVQRAAAIYRGSLYIPLQDGSGLMRQRAREMAKLYADILVLGSETALRLGKRKIAVHFAESATLIDGRREDAVCALIRALKAAGRADEAVKRYRAYLKKGSHGKKRVPSLELRAAIGTLLVEQAYDGAAAGPGVGREA